MEIKIRSNFAEFKRKLHKAKTTAREEAYAKALIEVAGHVQRGIRGETYPRAFTVRNRQFPKVLTATGGGIPVRYAVGFHLINLVKKHKFVAIFDRSQKSGWMDIHQKGGIKRPKRATSIAVPTPKYKAKLTSRGMPASMQPRALINAGGFILTSGNKRMIARRVSGGLEIAYILKPSVRIKKTFPMYKDIRTIAARHMDKAMKKHHDAAYKKVFKKGGLG